MTNTFRELLQRTIIETFDESDEKTWLNQQKDNEKDKDNNNDKYIWRIKFNYIFCFMFFLVFGILMFKN